MIYYKLENINPQNTRLFHDIAKLIASIMPSEKANKVLVVSIQNITDPVEDKKD